MKNFGFILCLSSLLFVTIFLHLGCTPQSKWERLNWTRQPHDSSLPANILSHLTAPNKNQNQLAHLSGYQVQHWRTTIETFPIEGTWIKVLRNREGELESIQGEVFSSEILKKNVITEAAILATRKQKILSSAWEKYPELKYAKKIFPVQVMIGMRFLGPQPYLSVPYLSKDESDVIELRLSDNGTVLERKSLAHHSAIMGRGQVFPGFPDRTRLSEVFFSNLVGDGTLTSAMLKAESEAGKRAFSPSHEFHFQPEDQAFDEVQAYYFVEQALIWLKNQHFLTLPFQLKLKLHVGGVSPTNSAFYFNENIFLGDGDNILYKRIPQDPSIVIHEAGHAVVQALAGLPNDKEGGSLNEAYADFLAANFLDNPRMAEYSYMKAPFRRSLENNLRAKTDFKGGLYHDSTIVSGTLWEIRKLLGKELACQLALQSLGRLGAGSVLMDFPSALQAASIDLSLDPLIIGQINDILTKRGWL